MQQAAAELTDAGLPFVESDFVAKPKARQRRLDILAWDADKRGALVPRLVVEVRRPAWQAEPVGTLQQLAIAARLAGVSEAYVYDGAWWQADPGFTSLEAAPRPRARGATRVRIEDATFLTTRLRKYQSIRNEAAHGRSDGDAWLAMATRYGSSSLTDLLRQIAVADKRSVRLPAELLGLNPRLEMIEVDRSTLLTASREVLRPLLERRGRSGYLRLPDDVADSLSVLLLAGGSEATPTGNDAGAGKSVLVPNAGQGELVLAVAESPFSRQLGDVTAWCPTSIEADLVEVLGGLTGSRVLVDTHDQRELPRPDSADLLVGVLPMGRGTESAETTAGPSHDGEATALLAWVEALKPRGRAVVLASRGLLSRQSAARVRDHVEQHYRVVAVIGLPAGALDRATSIATAILVIEAKAPIATLVAELKDDWSDQLRPMGSFWFDYVKQLGIR